MQVVGPAVDGVWEIDLPLTARASAIAWLLAVPLWLLALQRWRHAGLPAWCRFQETAGGHAHCPLTCWRLSLPAIRWIWASVGGLIGRRKSAIRGGISQSQGMQLVLNTV